MNTDDQLVGVGEPVAQDAIEEQKQQLKLLQQYRWRDEVARGKAPPQLSATLPDASNNTCLPVSCVSPSSVRW
ncbi:MAG: hypothetical protein V3V08_19725 [Nannocystaceae bacterium]